MAGHAPASGSDASPDRLPDEDTDGLDAVGSFIKGKIADAERAWRARKDMQSTWANGTDEGWRAVNCKLTKKQRLEESAMHGRIALKAARELQLFRAVLARIQEADND